MRKLRVFFLILIVATSGILLAAAQYGEESTSLGQFVDEFTDLNNVSVTIEVVRNSTLDVMELNVSAIAPNEDFTTYTEVDTNNKITVFEDRIEFIQLRRDDEGYVYFDYGIDFFDDWEFEFTVKINDTEAGDGDQRWISAIVTVCSYAQDFGGKPGGSDAMHIMIRDNGATDNSYKFSIWGLDGGVVVGEDIGKIRAVSNDELYLRFNRTDDDIYLWVYIDADYLILDETLTLPNTGFSDPMRYIHGIQTIDSANDGNIWMSGYVKDLWLGGHGAGYASEGYFTTTDYLDFVNGSTLAFMTQSKIVPNTHITIQFSDNNATWGDAEGIPGDSHDLLGGLETIDLRPWNESSSVYIMANLSTSDPAVTPFLNQTRLITTEGATAAAGPGAPGMNVSRETVTYNLTEIGVTVGTLDAGDLNSTLDIDGDLYTVSELVGAPGMQISGNFSGVDPDAGCLWVVIYAHYDGNLNHDFDIEVWNFTSSAWVEDAHITDGTELTWFNSTIYALRIPNEFLNGGEVRVRLDHEAPGNINHDLFIEYFKLLAEIPAGPTPGAGTVISIIESDFPWLAIAIILMCVAYLLFRSE